MQRYCFVPGMLIALLFVLSSSAQAQLTPNHRKELAAITKQVGQVAATIRKKDYDTAGTELTDAEEKLKAIVTEAGISDTDPSIKRVSALIERQRGLLSKATGTMPAGGSASGSTAAGGTEVSFVKDVAPIINERCIRCHGENNPRRNLRLDTFAGWRQGGQGGVLLVPGNPNASLLLARINAPQGQGRMPAQGEALSDKQKETIASWIKAGAKLDDGAAPTATLANLIFEEAKKEVKLPKPKGTETVSFTRDIAPFMANLCLNCHNNNRRTSGLSVENFFEIMKGGESGEVIIPGDHENSRMFRLVGGLELPRMPANQARITRQNYDDFKKWFEEGNTYDGNDPLTPIREFVPSDAELARRKFGTKSDAEMASHRLSQTGEQYRRATGQGITNKVETNEFLIVGDVDSSRLQTVSGWAKSQLDSIQKELGGGNLWRGKLAIFVWKDRTGYEQFASQAEQKRASRDVYGHAQVTLGHEDAYIVLQDTSDSPGSGPGLRETLAQQLTVAYLQRGERQIPNWIALGYGYIQSEPFAGPARLKSWRDEAVALAPAVNQPDELYVDGTFSPASTGAIGHTLLKFIEAQGGKDRFTQFRRAIERGESVNNAIKATYNTEGSTVASEFFKNLRAR
ncbi:MAG TPA: c-type cytochrome domain-containing protein [Planctomicrobium sp.]|nr:c-type cytochrome domain-containing protein [Planctomicrobium sp.]